MSSLAPPSLHHQERSKKRTQYMTGHAREPREIRDDTFFKKFITSCAFFSNIFYQGIPNRSFYRRWWIYHLGVDKNQSLLKGHELRIQPHTTVWQLGQRKSSSSDDEYGLEPIFAIHVFVLSIDEKNLSFVYFFAHRCDLTNFFWWF